MKLTADTVAALVAPAGKADHFEFDDELPGFGVRLRRGSKRWVVQYRVGSQQRRESLGDVRKISIADARKIARQRFAQAELGVDPGAARLAARAQAMTLAVVADRYLDAKRDRLRLRTFEQAQYHFSVLWRPLRDRPLDTIKRADIAARLQELIKQNGRTAAARARQNLSALFAWAMREGLAESNPAITTNNPAIGLPTRDRVLDDRELKALWDACEDDDFGRIVKLLLMTGCRREEIGRLKWSEINLETGLLTIPGARTKNRRTLELPLPAEAVEILKSVPGREEREYIFGRYGGRPFGGWSYGKLRLDTQITMATGAPLQEWVLHDLRRTMRSGLGRLGIAPHVAELAINHVRGGVEAIYDRHRYQREIGTALAVWADHLLAIVEDRESKVVTLSA